MAKQTRIIINEGLSRRDRTSASGTTKSRFSIDIEAQPLIHTFDNVALGAGPAAAIKKVIQDQIKGISQTASAGTLLARKYARSAFEKGASWAMRRYSGGRTGPKTPGKSDALFNDSGRLGEGLELRQNPSEENFVINVPANRLSTSTFKSEGDLVRMVDQLRALVPALGSPETLLDDPKVREAIEHGISHVLIHKQEQGSEAALELLETALETARSAAELGEAAIDE